MISVVNTFTAAQILTSWLYFSLVNVWGYLLKWCMLLIRQCRTAPSLILIGQTVCEVSQPPAYGSSQLFPACHCSSCMWNLLSELILLLHVPLRCTYRDAPPSCHETVVFLWLPATLSSTELQSHSFILLLVAGSKQIRLCWMKWHTYKEKGGKNTDKFCLQFWTNTVAEYGTPVWSELVLMFATSWWLQLDAVSEVM